MKRSVWIAVGVGWVVMAVAGAVSGLADDAAAPAAPTPAEVKHQALCPVMGEAVNTNLYVDADGKRIYVCCKMCVSTVKKEPAKYIKKLEDEGITLDKAPKADAPAASDVTPQR